MDRVQAKYVLLLVVLVASFILVGFADYDAGASPSLQADTVVNTIGRLKSSQLATGETSQPGLFEIRRAPVYQPGVNNTKAAFRYRLVSSLDVSDGSKAVNASRIGSDWNEMQIGMLTNGSTMTVQQDTEIYLPIILRIIPIPRVPVLHPIDNSDRDGNYTVVWDTAPMAETYVLQEAADAAFSTPTTRYTGSGTSWDATGKANGTYYYRVMASNAWVDSGWSNIESVTVDMLPVTQFAKPGLWTGTYESSFSVTTENKVRDFSVTLPIPPPMGGECKITLAEEASIEDKHFSLGIVQGVFKFVEGDFNTPTTLTGIFHSVSCQSQIWFYPTPLEWEASWKQP